MTQGISGYSSATTDEMLRRELEESGDHDPTNIQRDTGKTLHFDATDSAGVRREALHPTNLSAGLTGLGVLASKGAGAYGYEKACGYLAKQVFSPLLRMGAGVALEGVSQIATLGGLYNEAIEGPSHEGDRQRALAASDAGVVGMTQALDIDPKFKADVAQAHPGAGNAAAAVRVQIDGDPGVKSELQLRADRGFVDAAGYAKLAAHEMAPLYKQAASKLVAAKATSGDDAARLRSDAQGLMRQAAEAEKKYMAPVMGKSHEDAAYGIGAQYALHQALRAETSGKWGAFDAAFSKANERMRGVEPATVRIGG
jgi:hypothetical protein